MQKKESIYKFNQRQFYSDFSPLKKQEMKQLASPPLAKLKIYTDRFANYGVLGLFAGWSHEIRQQLITICDHFEGFPKTQEAVINRFVNIYQCLSFSSQHLYQTIFPGIKIIICRLEKNFGIPNLHDAYNKLKSQYPEESAFLQEFNEKNKLGIKAEAKIPQILISNYAHQIKENGQQQNSSLFNVIYQGQKTPLTKFITEYPPFYTGCSDWQDLLTIIQQQNNPKQKINLLPEKLHHKKEIFCCPGCAPFFYPETNIRDDSLNKVPIVLIPIKNLQNLAEQEEQLIQSVIALVNSQGGVILFDCQAVSLSIFPIGTHLNEQSKQRITLKLKSILQTIRCVEANENILLHLKIQFVPMKEASIIQNQRQQVTSLFDNIKDEKNTYAPGKYVTRITVSPLRSSLLFFSAKENCYHGTFTLEKGRVTPINAKEIRKTIKRKIKVYHVSDTQFEHFGCLTLQPQNRFGHICSSPNIGWPILFQPSSIEMNRLLKQRSFQSMCLLIAKQNNLPLIKSILTSMGISCSMEIKFKNYYFKSARYCSVLYHNLSHKDLLLQIDSNNQLEFENKKLLAINITRTLQMPYKNQMNRPSKQELDNLASWLDKQFPGEKLKVYEYKANEESGIKTEFYLKTESKTSILFMYHMLSSFNQKVVFKQPLCPTGSSSSRISLRQIYPSFCDN